MVFRILHTTHRFEQEVELAKHRGKDIIKLRIVIDLFIHRKPLPRMLNDHPLRGNFKGYRDLHLDPDWILLYKPDNKNVWLVRTGIYADLRKA